MIERADGQFDGFCIDILKEIAQRMNFKYEIYKVPDNRYGSDSGNGTWNGLVRELIDKVRLFYSFKHNYLFLQLLRELI